jgi:hypothetical protein
MLLLLILNLGSRWLWVVSITPRSSFSPRERIPGTHWTGGSVGPRAGLDKEARGKILSPLPGIETRSPGRPARSQTLYWLSYPAHCETSKKVKQSRCTPWRRLEERRNSSCSFTTSALYGCEWSASRPGRALVPRKGPPYPLYRRLGRSGHRGWRKYPFASAGDRTSIARSYSP